MTAMLAKFTAVPASVAHNLMLSLIFSLSAIGAYGLLYNLLTAYHQSKGEDQPQGILSALGAFLAPLFLLIVSNLEGFFESLHRRGIGWIFKADGTASSPFWSWIDLKELTPPPAAPLKWVPDQFFWWWRASRVIQDYDLNKARLEIIDEFPFFSYLLGDLHPHVLAMPFDLLAIAIALNIFFGGWRGRLNLFFGELRINKVGFLTIALVLGGLAFLNTWDILLGAALIVLSYALARVHESGWDWERVADVFLLGVPTVVVAFLMYLPFYVGFDSQAGGILPNFMYPTRGVHLWVMWGTLFIPLFAYLIYLWQNKTSSNWRAGILTSLGIVALLLAAIFIVGLMALKLKPDLILPVIQSQGRSVGTFIADSMLRRLTYIGSLLTLLALLIPALSFLFKSENGPSSFILLMVGLASLLILGPDFLYLRDNFGYRINTVFKFYYQAWILLSLAVAFAVAVMGSQLRGWHSTVYTVVMILVIGAGLVYPVFSLPSKTDDFKVRTSGTTHIERGSLPRKFDAG